MAKTLFARTGIDKRLVQDLCADIEAGRLRAGQPILSDRELGRRYGISYATVRRALARLAKDGWLERKPHGRTFVKKRPSPRSAAGTARAVRVVFYQSAKQLRLLTGYYMHLVMGIERALAEKGWDMVFSSIADAEEALAIRKRGMSEAGKIFVGPVEDRVVAALAGARPFVFVDHRPEAGGANAVANDELGGMRQAILRLAQMGHKRIAYIGASRNDKIGWNAQVWPNSLLREKGWRDAMAESGLPVSDAWAFAAPTTQEGGRAAFKVLKAIRPRPTAAISAPPRQAAGLIAAARKAGWKVPKDLSVIALGVLEDAASAELLELALLLPDVLALGRRSAELLVQKINDPDAPCQQILIPFDLKEGATLGPAP